jgi:DNA topoisomerase-1
MKPGDSVPLERVSADQHFTQPPPRFTEASLVKALEEYGIGRPSTYASIIQTLLFRKYAEMEGRAFRPTDVGRAVSKFLSSHFTRYVDYDFTAKLEDDLDAVSRGEEAWVPLMEKFWGPFKELVEDKKESLDRTDAGSARVLGIDPASGKSARASAASARWCRSARSRTRKSRSSPRCSRARASIRSASSRR